MESGKYGIEKSFGNNPFNYNDIEFNNYANQIKINEIHLGGLYMPLMIKKDYFNLVNGYPEGNVSENCNIFNPIYLTKDEVYIQGKKCISGDLILMKKLNHFGIQHYTIFDSIVYHIQEGEMKFDKLNTQFSFYSSKYIDNIKPIYIFYSIDGRMRIDLELFERIDGWYYNCVLNSFINNDNCEEFYIYKINENLNLNIFENTVISKAPPNIFLPNNNYYYHIDTVYFKNYIPFINVSDDNFKFYYNNGKIQLIY